VGAYPPVRGMAKPLFFLDHNHPEDGASLDEESKSKSNLFEVCSPGPPPGILARAPPTPRAATIPLCTNQLAPTHLPAHHEPAPPNRTPNLTQSVPVTHWYRDSMIRSISKGTPNFSPLRAPSLYSPSAPLPCRCWSSANILLAGWLEDRKVLLMGIF
jgi:hypothetical protein